ncbi:hypothetical protein QC764_501827 [Podospora pseudoanserina]|uniref:Cytochrome P450 E-class, group I n=1 Tax=Podospora pseudoanserina TaxID=2609844 RepID=A0ABR0I3U2_9PEZI|nr:hypothetical protein QC764_501827 [Podospora pseudoanserina]
MALFAARDRSVHSRRRRDWQPAFSPQAIRHYEEKVLLHIEELDQQLELKAKSGAVDWYESVDWCQEQIQARLAKGPAPELRDLTYYIMEKEKENNVDAGPWLRGIVCSPSWREALAAVLHELVLHPEHIDKLHAELGDTCLTDTNALAELPHLNAVIQEAMRLHPFLPTGGIRKTTDTGVTIRDVHIPPHTTVLTPLYTISLREDCFEQGSSFIPDRWTTRPEMVRNAAAHAPFSLGKYNCIGQHLAMRMMRAVHACAGHQKVQVLPSSRGGRERDGGGEGGSVYVFCWAGAACF